MLGDLAIGTIKSGVVYSTITDHLGTPVKEVDQSGAISESTSYDPFGKVLAQTGSLNTKNGYIGEAYDDATGLSYLNARYYDAGRGQFTSQDPVFWNFDQRWLADPQNQNSYSYARNNPIVNKDPTGLRTIVVPGTRNDSKKSKPKTWSENGKAKDFLNRVSKTFGEKAELFRWSGGNSVGARKEAASELAKMINDPNYVYKDGEKLNIVAHSHGGNIAILASRETDRKIDNLVTLGTPNRTVYQPSEGKIVNHINVYSRFDVWQNAGEWGDPLTASGVDERKFDGATNIGVGLRAGILPRGSHTNLWQNESVWSLVDEQFPKSSW